MLPWQVLQSPLPIAMWLAAPEVPTVPGGTTIVAPYQAIPEAWQVWHVSALTAVWPADESTGLPVSLNPVPLSVSVEAWQAPQSALLTGMWLPAPEVPSVPGGCIGWPPVPGPVPANGPLPAPWQAEQLSLVTDAWFIFDSAGVKPDA